MRNDQLYIYTLLLEKFIQDMELEDFVERITEELQKIEPADIWPDRITFPQQPLLKNNTCPLCGIDLNNTMCYTCINPKCPTGMGPLMCKA